MRKLLAIDPSLTCSGWSLFAFNPNTIDTNDFQLLGVGKIKSLSASTPLPKRLIDYTVKIKEVLSLCTLENSDYLVCEGPTSMLDPDAAIKVEQIRGLFEFQARELEIEVPGRINPRSVQSEILGLTGKQVPREEVKLLACRTVEKLYGTKLKRIDFTTDFDSLNKNRDIVDAILIGQLAINRIQQAQQIGLTATDFFDQLTYSRHDKSASRSSRELRRFS